jgi:pectate lyase
MLKALLVAISFLLVSCGGDTPPSGGTRTPGSGTSTSGGTITSSNCANPTGGYEGFGRNTTGGAGKPVYRVTNLNDSGPGSLRDAVSASNRCVVFDVGGTINLSSPLWVAANITIDGFTAPAPGITLRNYELMIHGWTCCGSPLGANNVIVRGTRHRDVFQSTGGNEADGITIYAASNVVIDHVSIAGGGDGSIDVTDDSHDVTIQWSIFADPHEPYGSKHSLVKYETSRVSFHHNLFMNAMDRQPFCGGNAGSSTPMAIQQDVVCDVRNNLVWGYTWVATTIREPGGTANVVNNYYYSSHTNNPAAAVNINEGGVAYASGNYSPIGLNINAVANRATPFPAPPITQTDAITAAHQILAQAGARGPNFGLDAIDQNRITQISLIPLR